MLRQDSLLHTLIHCHFVHTTFGDDSMDVMGFAESCYASIHRDKSHYGSDTTQLDVRNVLWRTLPLKVHIS